MGSLSVFTVTVFSFPGLWFTNFPVENSVIAIESNENAVPRMFRISSTTASGFQIEQRKNIVIKLSKSKRQHLLSRKSNAKLQQQTADAIMHIICSRSKHIIQSCKSRMPPNTLPGAKQYDPCQRYHVVLPNIT